MVAALLVAGQAGAVEEAVCDMQPDADLEAASPRWVLDGSGARVLHADVPGDLEYTVEAGVRLGALSTRWSQGPHQVEPTGTLVVELEPPAGAFLHPLAADYVTGLEVRIIGKDTAGQAQLVLPAPTAFLAWPMGQAGGHVVWDEATMLVEAPKGVVSEEIRARVEHLDVTRVLPPITATHVPFDADAVKDCEG